eukprot:608949-Pyramimonas_sp.AAC.1
MDTCVVGVKTDGPRGTQDQGGRRERQQGAPRGEFEPTLRGLEGPRRSPSGPQDAPRRLQEDPQESPKR